MSTIKELYPKWQRKKSFTKEELAIIRLSQIAEKECKCRRKEE